MSRGRLILVVGPSGAGKDTLMAEAARRRPELMVARRTVTRAADAGGEEIDSLDLAAFERAEAAGAFCLSWRAHGLAYGIPASVAEALAAGWDVMVNVSRRVVEEARDRLAPVVVVSVEAAPDVLRRRLLARGREAPEAIVSRLERAGAVARPGGDGVRIVTNDGALDPAVEAFLAAIQPESAWEER